MMTMTELFYGPIEPTWIAHPQIPANENCYKNPYAVYKDDATLSYRCNPYVQRHAAPYTTVAPSTCTQEMPGYSYQSRSCVHGGTAALAPVSTVYQQVAAVQSLGKQVQQSAAPLGVLQPRNVQTVHFMVPLCCAKCEERVKEKLLDLEDVRSVTSDQWKQKVSVTSTVAPEILLKRVQKIKKRSAFWSGQQQQTDDAAQVSNANQKPN